MKSVDIQKQLVACAQEVEAALAAYMANEDSDIKEIFDGQAYSLLGGGKRIRPYLVIAFCEALGGAREKAIPLACALEMIHTYSLIHDDLPCMDNDDYRRGRLTNHKVFGEATAVLAGDALLTKAFEVVSESVALSAEEKVMAVKILSRAAGDRGMIGGQIMDMAAQSASKAADCSYLIKMHNMKTGALIMAAAKLGCLAAGKYENDECVLAANRYVEKIGLAFQVVDDMLDVTGDATILGKNIGVDSALNKLTFMNFYSVEQAEAYASELTEQAITDVSPIDAQGELEALAVYLLRRKK